MEREKREHLGTERKRATGKRRGIGREETASAAPATAAVGDEACRHHPRLHGRRRACSLVADELAVAEEEMRARRRPRVTVLEASVVTVQSCRHLIIAGCCCACDVAASGSVTVEAGRGQKEKRPPSPPRQTQEGEGARGRGACYRRFCRQRKPLSPLRYAAVAIVGHRCRSRWLPELPPNRFSDRRYFIFLVRVVF
ncbi:uncharacterized protein DS421_15g510990 [Arachis hypogaea]|nr:uncharacterized protein DS421_15g510990 [Arachis hypogaea]